MNQQAREGEPLFLAAGEGLLPRGILMDTIFEMVEPHVIQCGADGLISESVRILRIGHCAFEGAERYVGALRQHEQL